MKKWLGIGLIFFFLTGCSMFGAVEAPAPTIYQINALPQVATKRPRAIALLVSTSQNNSIYGSTQMVYTNKPFVIAYFSKSRWAEAPINMLQQLTVKALQNTHGYRNVVGTNYMGNTDYVLTLQLDDLKQDFMRSPSVIRLSVHAQLSRSSTNKILATREFTFVEPAFQNTPYAGVVATNVASKKLIAQLVKFCQQYI